MSDKLTKKNWDSYRVEHGCKLVQVNLVEKRETWQCENGIEVVRSDSASEMAMLASAILFSAFFLSLFLIGHK